MKRSARTLSVLPLVAMVAGLLSGAAAPGASERKGDPAANVPAGRAGFVLSTTQPGGKGFAPAFVGNGYLAGRQPADG
ncbi:MAG: hypothetical protein QOE19_1031, partial [Actinomycetota bacterium]|nr:hypothetical protein [Actinomycetota bacterium]